MVQARLTLDGVTGSWVHYHTALLNPGGIMQLALQADAGGLATGRYSYSVEVQANYSPAATTTYSGSVNLLDSSASAFGRDWSLDGLDRLWPVAGGLILEQPGGYSLFFAGAGPSYASPAGDFSTLVRNIDNTYTRTLKDNTRVHFDANGRQTSALDRNGNTFTWGYDGSGKLTSFTDHVGRATAFAYGDGQNPGRVTGLTDPAGRLTQLGYGPQGRLTSITDPDPDDGGPLAAPVMSYRYDAGHRLTSLTSPRDRPTTFAYDNHGWGRIDTVTRPDNTTEKVVGLQTRGLAAPGSGTPGNPAPALLAVEARARYDDGIPNAWFRRLDWLGFGQSSQAEQPLAEVVMAVSHRDGHGLAWLRADPLGRRTRYHFDAKANPTRVTLPDDAYEDHTYNLTFSRPTSHRDATGFVTTYTLNASNGDLEAVTQPDPDGGGPLAAPVTALTYWPSGLVRAVTDPRNHTTSYTYDTWHRLTQAQHPDPDNGNPSETFGYDAAGNRTRRTDERGFTTSFAYDRLNRLTEEVRPDEDADPANNPKWTYGHDAASNPTSATNQTTTSAYTKLEQLEAVTDPLGHTTTYTYDAARLVRSRTDALGKTWTYDRDGAGRLVGVTHPAEGPVTDPSLDDYAYDAAAQLTAHTDPLNHTTGYAHDLRGRPARTTDALGNKVEFTSNAAGDRLTMKEVDGQTAQSRTTSFAYDALHRHTQATNALGHATDFGYDAAGNRTALTQPDPDGGGPLPRPLTTFAHDARNRLAGQTDPLGHALTFAYDAAGNRRQMTDPLGRVTDTAFDAQDRVRTVTQPDPDGGGPLGRPVTTHTYDLAGRLRSLTDPAGNLTTYAYDEAGRLWTVTDPRNEVTTYGYDEANRLTSPTDRNGRQRTFDYSARDLRTRETWLDGGGGTLRTVTYTYDAAARLTGARDPDSNAVYQYDAADRLTTLTLDLGPAGAGVGGLALTQGYDGFHDRRSLADNRNGRIDFTFDAGHRLTQASLTVSAAQGPQVTLGYDPLDGLTSLVRKVDSAGPSVSSALAYDNGDRVTSISHSSSVAGALATYGYTL